jgi:6-phosphogluconolactonase
MGRVNVPQKLMRGMASAVLIFQLFVGMAFAAAKEGKEGKEYFVYIGTYTLTQGKGIYTFRFQPATGKLTPLSLAAETSSPAFLAVHPNQRFLYAANEHEGEDRPRRNNSVSAYSIDSRTGALTFLNKVSSRGEGPAHVVVDKQGRFVLVSNYRSGSVALLPIQPDGRLQEATGFDQHQGSGPNKQRQAGPHAHGGVFSPDNRFALVAEHGADEVMIYRLDPARGSLNPNDPPFVQATPGAAPRHLTFHPDGRIMYALNELGSSVTVFDYAAAEGALRRVQEITTVPPVSAPPTARLNSRWLPRESSSTSQTAAVTASPSFPSIRQTAPSVLYRTFRLKARYPEISRSTPPVRSCSQPIRTPTISLCSG